jgi:hydrogenase nickel incorporation protein HypA/HybF
MHEESLVRQLLRQVQAIADEYPASQVRSISVRIGEFSGVEPEFLSNAYSRLVGTTQFPEAQLVAERVKLQATCRPCNYEFSIKSFTFRCPCCGSSELSILGGEELLLDSITMENPNDEPGHVANLAERDGLPV